MKTALIVEDLPDIREWLSGVVTQAFAGIDIKMCSHLAHAKDWVNTHHFDLALIDLGLPDGNGCDVVGHLRLKQPSAMSVVVTIYDDDEHLFPALQAGAFGYLLKEQPSESLVAQLVRMTNGEPPLSPSIARRVLAYFAQAATQRATLASQIEKLEAELALTDRETEVLQRVAKGYTLPEIAVQLGLSRHTVAGYVKSMYRKLNVSSRAEAALVAARLGLIEQQPLPK